MALQRQLACLYSTVPLLTLDETAKTATLTFHTSAPTYSFFGGNNGVLNNGDIEFCEAAEPTALAGDVYEVTQGGSSQTVWHMKLPVSTHIGVRGCRACIPACSGNSQKLDSSSRPGIDCIPGMFLDTP